ncbi:MAG: aminoglycoside phosphotransferase family protein [Gammaproteobacteria bacterium]
MKADARLIHLNEWIVENLGNIEYSLTPVSGDASFRRYFRLTTPQAQYIAVDSPPEKESNDAFVNVTHLLGAEGLPVPHIYYSSLDFGFFLLSDLGDKLLLDVLTTENADDLYHQALDALILVQQTEATSIPVYSEGLLMQEMELFREWFLIKHLNLTLNEHDTTIFDSTFSSLMKNAVEQPQVFVHRDYHSRNLMAIKGKFPGIIDYQDAVLGPVTYDLVSLLRDCYISWPDEKVHALTLTFHKKLIENRIISEVSATTFTKWFDLMGIQRHLKAVGIFARLNIRDSKPNYLEAIPRTLSYIKSIAIQYPETKKLAEFIGNNVNI